jgi:hypothetical protein
MEFWDSFDIFVEVFTRVGKKNKNTATFSVDNPIDNVEKLRNWAYHKRNTQNWNKYDLSFIPNEKLRLKLEDCLPIATSQDRLAYFEYIYRNLYDFEDCFTDKPIRDTRWNLEPLLSEVVVSSNVDELNKLKADLVAKDNEITELRRQLEDDNESKDWTKGSIVSLMEAVVYD